MKKLISILLIFSFCITMLAGCRRKNKNTSEPKEETDKNEVIGKDEIPSSDGLTYRLSSDGTYYEVVDIYNCENVSIEIPSTYNGLPVKSIVCGYPIEYDLYVTLYMRFYGSGGTYGNGGNVTTTSITIPGSITYIDDAAFNKFEKLESISVSESNTTYKSIDGNLYSKDGKTLLLHAPGKREFSFAVPDGVTHINYSAIGGYLKSVTIPKSVVHVDKYAFYGDVVEVINNSDVELSGGLITHNGSTRIVSVGDYRFFSYQGIDYLVSYVGNDTELNLPADYQGREYVIYPYAFANTANPVVKVNISAGVSEIHNLAFAGCDTVADIMVDSNNAEYTSFDGNVYSKSGKMLLFLAPAKTNIVIPDHVTSIAQNSHLGNVESIKIGNGITNLSSYTFNYCYNLKSVTLGSGISSISTSAFSGCYNLTNITVDRDNPNFKAVDNILYSKNGETLVWCAPGKGKVVIPDSVRTINNDAFNECADLTSVTVGSGVEYISENPFPYRGTLTNITISPDNQNYKAIDNVVYSKDGTKLVMCLPDKTEFVVPDGVRSIGNYAFNECTSLTGVTLPDSLETIGNYAFDCCYVLTKIDIPNNVRSIGEGAFTFCEQLKNITIPDSVERIGDNAFDLCLNLENVTIGSGLSQLGRSVFPVYDELYTSEEFYTSLPYMLKNVTISENNPYYKSVDNVIYTKDGTTLVWCITNKTDIVIPYGVENIEDYAFYYCSALKSVVIPDSVTSIGKNSFYGTKELVSLTLGSSLSVINGDVFSNSNKLANVTISANNPYFKAVDNVIYSKDGTTLLWCAPTKTELVIADGVTQIDNSALRYCRELTSVTIPDSLTYIESSVFSSCYNITDLTIGSGLSSIETCISSFTGLTSITISGDNPYYKTVDNVIYTKNGETLVRCSSDKTELVIPDSVVNVLRGAFADCDKIERITVGSELAEISNSTFYGCNLKNITISSSNQYYKAVDNVIYSKDGTTLVWCLSGKTEFVIPYGVTTIADYAFYGLTYSTNAIIVDSLTGITGSDSVDDGKLKSIVIPNSVTSIGNYAFSDCDQLTSIVIPNSVTSIGNYAFAKCKRLTSIVIPDSVTRIGDYAFSSCARLVNISIGSGVAEMTGYAFDECYRLADITVSANNAYYKSVDNVIYSEDGKTLVFCAPGKTDVTILNGVTTIGANSFKDCYRITDLVIPGSVTKIEKGAFEKAIRYAYVISGETLVQYVTYLIVSYSLYKGEVVDDYNSQLTSVHFTNPTGWSGEGLPSMGITIGPDGNPVTVIVDFSEAYLSNPQLAAEYLKNTYVNYEWTRS